MKKLFILPLVIGAFSYNALAAEGPCKQIEAICKSSGFVYGEAKAGYGLMRDCVNPVMQGATNVPGATKQPPQVDPNLVSSCKAKHPKFGMGPLGSNKKAN